MKYIKKFEDFVNESEYNDLKKSMIKYSDSYMLLGDYTVKLEDKTQVKVVIYTNPNNTTSKEYGRAFSKAGDKKITFDSHPDMKEIKRWVEDEYGPIKKIS